jgi:hypothetical protein
LMLLNTVRLHLMRMLCLTALSGRKTRKRIAEPRLLSGWTTRLRGIIATAATVLIMIAIVVAKPLLAEIVIIVLPIIVIE